ncbi:YoaK family protein [Sphingomonas sanxanigenens]|uniref:Major facilitator superfamily (MFS) profile domain-containing protein n=1 Tax=Sphingomonas sanxanigenens DSM 19645 = NX02 TaxID=1123269 RepID=W0A935_9SPHN|nr:YoaK family protein [Sphingomonas sanxanigenens]AHE52858.1 hypothetical protein NX02_05605 [Sphingomonas sanxanigenens DSM 19645 = NX02]
MAPPRPRRRAAPERAMRSLNRGERALAYALAGIAGFVDGVGFVWLGGYFVSFMSGNSTRLAVAAAGGAWEQALFGLGLVALFIGGVAGGHLIAARAGSDHARIRRLLLVEALLLLVAAWLFRIGMGGSAIPLMVLAMGLANAIVAPDGQGFAVTYMTGALVRIGEGIANSKTGARGTILPWLLLWLALVGGAVTGGVLSLRWGGIVLGLPAAALLVLALSVRAPSRKAGDGPWQNPPPAST